MTGFYYNKAIFADNGLPELTNETTYEELLDMVKTLHDNGVTTFAQGAMTNYSLGLSWQPEPLWLCGKHCGNRRWLAEQRGILQAV